MYALLAQIEPVCRARQHNILQHTATDCNRLHTCGVSAHILCGCNTPSCCNTLQQTETHCNRLWHPATHCKCAMYRHNPRVVVMHVNAKTSHIWMQHTETHCTCECKDISHILMQHMHATHIWMQHIYTQLTYGCNIYTCSTHIDEIHMERHTYGCNICIQPL